MWPPWADCADCQHRLRGGLPVCRAGATQHADHHHRQRQWAYFAFANRYAAILKKAGVTLEVRTSAGSVENIERLRKGEVDMEGFVRGGILPPADDADAYELHSLGSMYYEPVWVFIVATRICAACTS